MTARYPLVIDTNGRLAELPSGDTVNGVAFVNLTDVPASYTGQSLKVVRVNVGESALEFATASAGSPGGTSGQIQYNNSGAFGGVPTVNGDGTLNTTTGALAVTKTGGVSFATSATTDATNAANISSGNLPAARITTNLSAALDSALGSTQGSVLYRGASAWAALGPGTANQVLQSNGAAANPTWVTPAGGSIGAGAEVLISEQTPTGSGVVTFSSIPGTYRHLRVRVTAASTVAASNSAINMTFNNDTGNNYQWQRIYGNNVSAVASNTAPAANIELGALPGATAPTNEANTVDALILNYTSTAFNKTAMIQSALRISAASTGIFVFHYAGVWFPGTPVAITRLDVNLSSGNYVTGSIVSLYGIK
jgi:hypothetical protein